MRPSLYRLPCLFASSIAAARGAGRASAVAVCLAAAAPLGLAQTAFTYQGNLVADGVPVAGDCDFIFRLYDAETGGAPLGHEAVIDEWPVSDGAFMLQLDFGTSAFDGGPRWLQVEVRLSGSGGPHRVLSPRQPLTPVPYAMFSFDSAGRVWRVSGEHIITTHAGNVGIGTSDPQRLLDAEAAEATLRLTSTGASPGAISRLQLKSPDAPGVFTPLGGLEFVDQSDQVVAAINGSKDFTGAGHLIVQLAPNALPPLQISDESVDVKATLKVVRPVDGVPSASIGAGGEDSYLQLHGGGLGIGTDAPQAPLHVESEMFAAIRGVMRATAGINEAVEGVNHSTSGRGVLGAANATTGANFGVLGQSFSSSGTGVHGFAAASSGVHYGVAGSSNGSAGWGVYSFGRLGAAGTKSFRIDHPDDPENRYLLHYSAESPEVINFYRGTATLDESGQALVELPSYFGKISKSPSYQLTAVGAPMPHLHIAVEIDSAALNAGARAAPGTRAPICSFRIAGGAPRGRVSWRVEAVRNDRFVAAYGAPVEVEKRDDERGRYQIPALYGHAPERGMPTNISGSSGLKANVQDRHAAQPLAGESGSRDQGD